MKCALEMKMALVEKKAKEEMERLLALQEKVNNEMTKYQSYLPTLNKKVEEALLEGNGIAELFFDTDCNCLEGFFYLGWKDYSYLKTRPYWDLRRSSSSNVYIEHYCEFLRNLCYEVDFVKTSFLGWSSTGKTNMEHNCYKLIVKIPE